MRPATRHVVFARLKVSVHCPWVRTWEGQEVELDTYTQLHRYGRQQRAVREGIVAGLTLRNYQRVGQSVLGGLGDPDIERGREFGASQCATVEKTLREESGGIGPGRRFCSTASISANKCWWWP